MSAVSGGVILPEVPGPIHEHGREEKAPLPATIYFFIIGAVAAGLSIPLLTQLRAGTHSWATFIILGSAAALAQLFVVRTPRNQSYHTTIVFLIPAVMLLPPELVGPPVNIFRACLHPEGLARHTATSPNGRRTSSVSSTA